MRIFTMILISLIMVSCVFRSSDYYNLEAEKLEAVRKYKEAIVLLDKAIEKNPENIFALMNRGVDKSILKDYEGAIEDYSSIIEIDYANTLAYLNRGKNKMRLLDTIGAIVDFNRAIKTKGGEYLYFDKVDNPYIDNGYEFDVEMAKIKYERGLALYDIDSLKVAFDDFKFCIKSNYQTSASYYMIGIIYIAYGMTEEACESLNEAKKLGDSDAQRMIDEFCND